MYIVYCTLHLYVCIHCILYSTSASMCIYIYIHCILYSTSVCVYTLYTVLYISMCIYIVYCTLHQYMCIYIVYCISMSEGSYLVGSRPRCPDI